MSKFFMFVLVALSLVGCAGVSEQSVVQSDAAPTAPVVTEDAGSHPVARTWSLLSRKCTADAIPSTNCTEWTSEAIPDVNYVTNLDATFGAWQAWMHGMTHDGGQDQVTLWFQRSGDADYVWVTATCAREDSEQTNLLFDTAAGVYFEVSVLCSVSQ
jgi:hypothetical protein